MAHAAIISAALGAASSINQARQAGRARSQQAAAMAQQQQQATLRQQIEERRLERERRSEEASARARLGAAGVGSGSGSGEAVLLGLNNQFDQQLADNRALFNASMGSQSLLDDDDPFGTILGVGQSLVNLGSVINDRTS